MCMGGFTVPRQEGDASLGKHLRTLVQNSRKLRGGCKNNFFKKNNVCHVKLEVCSKGKLIQKVTSVDELEQQRPPEQPAEPQLLLGAFHCGLHRSLFPREETLALTRALTYLRTCCCLFALRCRLTVDVEPQSGERASVAAERRPRMNRRSPGGGVRLRPQRLARVGVCA